MKRALCLALTGCLMLAGCQREKPKQETDSTEYVTVPVSSTEPLLVPDLGEETEPFVEDYVWKRVNSSKFFVELADVPEYPEDSARWGLHIDYEKRMILDVTYRLWIKDEAWDFYSGSEECIPVDLYLFADDQLIEFTVDEADEGVVLEGNRLYARKYEQDPNDSAHEIDPNKFRISFTASPDVQAWFLVANPYPEYIPKQNYMWEAGTTVYPIYNLSNQNMVEQEQLVPGEVIPVVSGSKYFTNDSIRIQRTPLNLDNLSWVGNISPMILTQGKKVYSIFFNTVQDITFGQIIFLDGKLLYPFEDKPVGFFNCAEAGGAYLYDLTSLVPPDGEDHVLKVLAVRMPTREEKVSMFDPMLSWLDFYGRVCWVRR